MIYAFKEVFGRNFCDVFGSLKDVKGVKGQIAYLKLLDFMKNSNINYTDFSSCFNFESAFHIIKFT